MVVVNKQVTELAAGFEVIEGFLETMRSEWLPGFERSFVRRNREYQEALEKHNNRRFFLRTLLRKPKQPKRMPARYPAHAEARLRGDWVDSWRSSDQASQITAIFWLHEVSRGEDLVLLDLSLRREWVLPLVILGSRGILLPGGVDRPIEASDATYGQIAAVHDLLQSRGWPEIDITTMVEDWQSGEDKSALERMVVLELADLLLSCHQELNPGRTLSAMKKAEKLAVKEKYNLLKMAANL